MLKEYACPYHNEEEFIHLAKRLGITELVFVYKECPEKRYSSPDLAVVTAVVVKGDPRPQKDVLLLVNDAQKVRFAAEHPLIGGIFGIEEGQRDFMHHRGSAMNQVIAKLLAEKSKRYIVDVGLIMRAQAQEQARIMGRIAQNLRLCKKYGVRVEIGSFARTPFELRKPKDLQAMIRLLSRI